MYRIVSKSNNVFIVYRHGTTSVPTIAVSKNSGSTWSDYSIAEYKGNPNSVAVDPQNNSVLFAGGYYNRDGNKGFISKSIDGGSTWTTVYELAPNMDIYSISIDPSNTNNVYFGAKNGIFKSTNGGQSWKKIHSDYCRAISISDNGIIYGACYGKVVCSNDGGDTWITYNNGMSAWPNRNSLTIDNTNNILYVGTDCQGILSLNLTITGIPENEINTPRKYKLSQNYPNPFNSGTVIRYYIRKSSKIDLSIYNSLGQKIRTLVNAESPPGEFQVNWNGTDDNGNSIPSGVYFYRINAGRFSDTKKTVLIK
ncbi:FlgD immunoglobulin-like domain containing protein [candidate division KSB1 bacterium]